MLKNNKKVEKNNQNNSSLTALFHLHFDFLSSGEKTDRHQGTLARIPEKNKQQTKNR